MREGFFQNGIARVQPQPDLKLLNGRTRLVRLSQSIRQSGMALDGIGIKTHGGLKLFDGSGGLMLPEQADTQVEMVLCRLGVKGQRCKKEVRMSMPRK